jgi:hypothetical protein
MTHFDDTNPDDDGGERLDHPLFAMEYALDDYESYLRAHLTELDNEEICDGIASHYEQLRIMFRILKVYTIRRMVEDANYRTPSIN